ncbi:hypothetical protein HanXRQr2_Chr12g0522671 [Helianthus annuus]|uniref:Uncharacterized protein n=1 Tax=Helianthus annuus TaxID=4232 RepID=A0A9K3ENS5_HELAN|nr:hypothetical protein HanXRQr2_Chr12g0522671 [Helianthus annuus]KAJ0491370.1 hypothetical protein HanIR_Chr12g0563091 [Helianthus annuus]
MTGQNMIQSSKMRHYNVPLLFSLKTLKTTNEHAYPKTFFGKETKAITHV